MPSWLWLVAELALLFSPGQAMLQAVWCVGLLLNQLAGDMCCGGVCQPGCGATRPALVFTVVC
jgi:hypothetical protein